MKKVAFICVHNSCRSQIAEAIGKLIDPEKYEFYSAGSEIKDEINHDAVRLVKEIYGVDMSRNQRPKLFEEIPEPDIVISMGCGAVCPSVYGFDDDWGIPDPTGKNDDEFIKVIKMIENKIRVKL